MGRRALIVNLGMATGSHGWGSALRALLLLQKRWLLRTHLDHGVLRQMVQLVQLKVPRRRSPSFLHVLRHGKALELRRRRLQDVCGRLIGAMETSNHWAE